MLIIFRSPVRAKLQADGDLDAARDIAQKGREIVRLGGCDE
jgi:hypothetical protein